MNFLISLTVVALKAFLDAPTNRCLQKKKRTLRWTDAKKHVESKHLWLKELFDHTTRNHS